MKNYLTQVQKHDGINQQEALLLAQSELIFRGYENKYYIDQPDLFWEDATRWAIKFYPKVQTLAQVQTVSKIVVIVDKKSGRVFWRKK